MEPASILKIIHLLGLVMGFGGAMLASLAVLKRAVLKPLSHEAIRQIRGFGRYIWAGIALLWISGAGLAILNIALDDAYASNPKLWTKLALISILTVNGAFIQRFALRKMEKSLGRRLLFDGPTKEAALMSFIGSLSFASWWMAFVVGAAAGIDRGIPVWKFAAASALVTLLCWSVWLAVISARNTARERRVPARRFIA
jgi:uncharacterized membrane protein